MTGLLAPTDHLGDRLEHLGLGDRPADPPDPLLNRSTGQSCASAWTSSGKRHRRRACFSRVGEHPHGTQQGGRQLLGPPDPVEEPGHRTEGVVDRDVIAVGLFQLLQHRRGDPGGEDVTGQQQHRKPVDGGQRGAGQHVAGARSDGGGDGEGLQPVELTGIADGDVHHRLLVAALVIGQFSGRQQFGLQQRLAEAGDIAVPEDPEAAGEELALHAVPLRVLLSEEFHHGLCDGQPDDLARGRAGLVARALHQSSPSAVVPMVMRTVAAVDQSVGSRAPCRTAAGDRLAGRPRSRVPSRGRGRH